MTKAARLARSSDLASLLRLFDISDVSASASAEVRETIWRETLEQPGLALFVAPVGDEVVATAMLITAPNLLRSGRRHGFLENVVTHPDFRDVGHGSAVVQAALDHGWRIGCHHVLMQSGRKDERVHAFYEGLGFRPGLRTAYVAYPPGNSIV